MIKSISFNQEEIIGWILKLHCKSAIQLDPTYSKGHFYKGLIQEPLCKYDLHPQTKYTQKADVRCLPFESCSFDTIMFDPPFLATKGKSLTEENASNKINKRFGVFPTEKELHTFYRDSLKELYRVLKDDGVLIFKCQDKVSSGKQYLSHVFIINEAINTGFYVKDMFILLAKNRIMADWQSKNQKNARKFHSYFLVLEKSKKTVMYT